MVSRMDQNTYFFVEDFLDGFDYGSCKVVALTPEACFRLTVARIPYTIIEDYYSEDRLAEFADGYYPKQMAWFERFEHYLRTAIPYVRDNDLNLIFYLRFRIKYFLDSLMTLAFTFNSFLREANCGAIQYHRKSGVGEVEPSFSHLNDNQRRFLFPVLAAICRGKNIPCEIKCTLSALSALTASKETLLNPRQHKLREAAKAVYFFHKYEKASRLLFTKDAIAKGLSILFLSAGHKELDPVLRDFVVGGARVFLRTGTKIFEISRVDQPLLEDVASASRSLFDELRIAFEDAAVRFAEQKELLLWIDEQAQATIHPIALPYFQYFIRYHCRKTAAELPTYAKFYREKNVLFVIGSSATNFDDAAPFMAAQKRPGLQRICFQHGCHAIDFPLWRDSQEPYFEAFFCTDPESYEHTRKTFTEPEKVFEYASFLKPPHSSFGILKRVASKKIFYLPTRGPVGVRILNAPRLPPTWHYHLQIGILDYLSTLKDYRFVYKYVATKDWLSDSTLAYLHLKKYKNVEVSSEPFWKCLHRAKKVIMDHPGTAFYESVAAHIPVLGLVHQRFKLRDTAKHWFGKSLQPYVSLEDAKRHIWCFLNSAANEYTTNLRLTLKKPYQQLVESCLLGKQGNCRVDFSGAVTSD